MNVNWLTITHSFEKSVSLSLFPRCTGIQNLTKGTVGITSCKIVSFFTKIINKTHQFQEEKCIPYMQKKHHLAHNLQAFRSIVCT